MAVFPLSTTFCEVTYDSDWYEDDRHLTPYRYSLLRNDTDSNSDTVSLTLPSYTYYEYLRSLYDCRTTATGRIPPTMRALSGCGQALLPKPWQITGKGYPGSSNGRISEDPERARTWHAFGKDTGSELSRAAIRSEPTKIRPAYPFPSLHLIQGGDSGDEYEEEYAFTDRSKQKLVWVDALNKWVPEHQLHPRPYMTFIGNAPVIEQAGRTPHFRENEKPRAKSEYGPRTDVHSYISVVNSKEIRTLRSRPDTFGGGREDHPRVCERFELHMGKTPQPLPKPSNQQRNNEKREAIRKRAQEMAEQRKQRKAYSSPLYTSLADRRLKKRAQSSKSANTAPTSPVQRKEVSSSPRPPIEAWQPNEGDRLKLQTPPKPPLSPVKKEISIKLVKAEDPEPEPAAERPVTPKDKIDKKVKFHEEPTPPTTEKPKSPKKKKDPDELSKEELEAKLALERLKESLEKQRQQQILEQQRILKERELEEERLRIEKEKGEEEEQLKRLKSLEKKPLTQNSSNHENYYKNTMNAADQLFSQKDQKETLKENDKNTKPRTNIHKPIETKNKKNSDLKPVPKKAKIRNEGIINKDKDKIEAKETIVEESETNSKKKPDIVEKISKVSHEKAKLEKGLVKIVEEQDKAIEDNLDPLLKGSKGKQESRKQKGKGKGKIQKVKTPKSDKQTKSTKPAEKEKKGLLKRENTFPQIKKTKKEKVQKLKNLDKKLLDQTTRQFKEVTQTTPQTKPVKAGMTKRPLTMPVLSPKQREPIFKQEIPLPITAPSESKLDNIEEPEEPKPTSAHRERRKSIVQQREIIKKERRDFRKCVKKDDEPEQEKLPEIDTDVRKVESWIYGTDDFSEKKSESSEKSEVQVEALPSLTQDLNPELIEKKKEAKEKRRKSVLANLIATENTIKKWKRPGIKDSSYLDELRRMELAEERRKKQMEMYERLKNRRKSIFGYSTDDGSPSFEDYGFLAKYCIFTKGNIEMYRHAFDAVDDSKAGWLEGEDVMIALRGVNNKLTEAEEEYLYRVLELTGYQITHGADFKMFSVLAALSQRISALDKWMKNFIGKMDFKQLEMKMFKCKTLWECNVDKDSNSISLDQLCVELRAGGVSLEHEMECREKLSHLPSLDLLDFLTYVPLFIMIHESVVTNPLDDSRVK